MGRSKNLQNQQFDILFEPVAIGPHTAKNRFYQVPHCNGGGYRDPSAVAEMRRIKAEGGWGVIFTEQCEIHHTSEITPFIELRLWDDSDIPMLQKMATSVKEYGALAGIELAYSGVNGPNFYSREVPRAVSSMPIRTFTNDPVQARELTKSEIGDLRRWFVNAAKRAVTAEYDLICLYGAHGFGIIQHFLSSVTNHRTDEYGGSLENRSRFIVELIKDLRDAVGDKVGIALRLSLQEIVGDLGFSNQELREFVEMNKDLPDLWDFAHGTWDECSGSSRFTEEGAQYELVEGIRKLTDKPVVGVGRFTSPDEMVRQIKTGTLDLIGCARPSIADPFLPKKISEGRIEDIRECIGCNICITGDMTMTISRCTQNPTFMEEWRKGWHPEQMNEKGESKSILVVGAGPAGLEATRALAERGYEVTLAEATKSLGGRVVHERLLPGLSAWGRVADYREYQLREKSNVEIYFDSQLTANDIFEFGFEHVCIATGAFWRKDGIGRQHLVKFPISDDMPLLTPDDIMQGEKPKGKVIIYDDDHYYMGGVLAEKLIKDGHEVTIITPSSLLSEWTVNTLEQFSIHKNLADLGVEIILNRGVIEIAQDHLVSNCVYTGKLSKIECDSVVLVTSKIANSVLHQNVQQRKEEWSDFGIKTVEIIGDANAPGPIAWAIYAGHQYAREFDGEAIGDKLPFRRELANLSPN